MTGYATADDVRRRVNHRDSEDRPGFVGAVTLTAADRDRLVDALTNPTGF